MLRPLQISQLYFVSFVTSKIIVKIFLKAKAKGKKAKARNKGKQRQKRRKKYI
jgi:hypothetical protein